MDLALQTETLTNSPHVYTMGTAGSYTRYKRGICIQISLS